MRECFRGWKAAPGFLVFIAASLPMQGQAAHSVKRVEIVAKRFSYEPSEITLKRGQPVELVLNSTDTTHGFAIRELGINLVAKEGAHNEVTFTPSKTGEFSGKCNVFCGTGHSSMRMTVRVVD
jgi:cytochrome c oxidase subunit II